MEDIKRENHNAIIENRKKITLTGVKDVLSFDEETIALETCMGKLVVKGNGLHIINFNTETGDLTAEGRIHAHVYTAEEKNEGFFARIFR